MPRRTRFQCQATIRFFYGLLLILVCGTATAGISWTAENGRTLAIFDDLGDIYLRGQRIHLTSISSVEANKRAWVVRSSASAIKVVLALEPLTINGTTTLSPGDLVYTGSFYADATLSSISTDLLDLKNSAGNVVLAIRFNGDFRQLQSYAGQPSAEKIQEEADHQFEIKLAYVKSPPFAYQPADLNYIRNRGGVYDYKGDALPSNYVYDPTNGSNPYRYSNSISGEGDDWTVTAGRGSLWTSNTDGLGLSFSSTYALNSGVIDKNFVTYGYPTETTNHESLQPRAAVSRFWGRPGSVDGLGLASGETVARFLHGDWTPSSIAPYAYQFANKNLHAYVLNQTTRYHSQPASTLFVTDHSGTDTLYLTLMNEAVDLSTTENGQFIQGGQVAMSYDAGQDKRLGEYWEPLSGTWSDGDLNAFDQTTHRIWTEPPAGSPPGIRFAEPDFIQFGDAYSDYRDSGAGGLAFDGVDWNDTSPGAYYYVYAISPPRALFTSTSQLYLGRCKLRHGHREDIWNVANWTYWAGTDNAGGQVWTSYLSKAVEILYSEGELGWPSVIYHKPSNRFLMATYTMSDKTTWIGRFVDGWAHNGIEGYDKEVFGGRNDHRWILWEADNPWGPWRKIMETDYNGQQRDIANLDRTGASIIEGNPNFLPDKAYAHVGYTVQLIPTWFETDTEDGGWKVWAMQSGFRNLYGATGQIYESEYDWYFPFAGYTPQFMQIHLHPNKRPIEGQASAVVNYQQNTSRRQAQANTTVGVHFTVNRTLTPTYLGRWAETLSSQPHDLSIRRVSIANSQATQISTVASVSGVDMDARNRIRDEHGFVYGKVTPSENLTPGNNYLLLSTEAANGDWFFGKYDASQTVGKNTMSMAEEKSGNTVNFLNGAEYDSGSGRWNLENDLNKPADHRGLYPGNAINLLNFLFTPSTRQLFSLSPGFSSTQNAPSTSYFGCSFQLKDDIAVTHLGRWHFSGDSGPIEVRLIRYIPAIHLNAQYDSGIIENPEVDRPREFVTVARVVVNQAGPFEDGYAKAELPSPVRLTPTLTIRPGSGTMTVLNTASSPWSFTTVAYNNLIGTAYSADRYFLVCREVSGQPYATPSNLVGYMSQTSYDSAVIDQVKAGFFSVNAEGAMITTWSPTTLNGDSRTYGPVNMWFE